MTFAIVNVLPEPVTPSRVTASTPLSKASHIPFIADGWSPEGLYSESILNFAISYPSSSDWPEIFIANIMNVIHFPLRKKRDELARLSYLSDKKGKDFDPNDILMIDIMRGEIKADDPRLR